MRFFILLACSSFAFSSAAQAQEIAGFRFGAGIGVVHDLEGDRVDEAEVVNGIVRVNSDNNTTVRLVGESHMYAVDLGKVVMGPFVAVQVGGSDVIDSFGAGWMVGVRLSSSEKKNTLNFGLGLAIDPGVRRLRNGIVEDQPLPVGETDIEFRKSTQVGLLFVTSYGF